MKEYTCSQDIFQCRNSEKKDITGMTVGDIAMISEGNSSFCALYIAGEIGQVEAYIYGETFTGGSDRGYGYLYFENP